MPNIRISDAADAGTLVASDMLPLARSGDTNAYHATMTEIAAFASTSLASGAYGNVGRNVLHNPLFNVAQRGAGPWTTAFVYTVDRWVTACVLDTFSFAQNPVPDATRAQIGDESASFELANTFAGNAGATAVTAILQNIESVHRLSGKTVTVSFYAACLSGNLRLGCSVDQNFGAGGSPSAAVLGAGQSVTLTPTWARYSLTFSLPSVSGKTLGSNGGDNTALNFWYSGGANYNVRTGSVGVQSGTVGIWGVQIEVGSVATPLEKPDPRYDLSNCQRFYQGSVTCSLRANVLTGGGTYDGTVSFPAMRAVPTATLLTLGSVSPNAASSTLVPGANGGGRFEVNFNSGGDSYALGQIWSLSADL